MPSFDPNVPWTVDPLGFVGFAFIGDYIGIQARRVILAAPETVSLTSVETVQGHPGSQPAR